MAKVEIDKKYPLEAGDVIELVYNVKGPAWVVGTALTIIESALNRKKNYSVEAWSHDPDKGQVSIEVKIIDPTPPSDAPPEVQQAGIGAAIVWAIAVIGGGVFVWLSLDKIYKIVDTPAGQVAVAGGGSMALVAGLAGLAALFGLAKK